MHVSSRFEKSNQLRAWVISRAAGFAFAISIPLLGCECEKSRDAGRLMLEQVHEASLACCRKLADENPALVAPCIAEREVERSCLSKIIDDSYASCVERRRQEHELAWDDIERIFERVMDLLAECAVFLIHTPSGETLNPIPVLPVETIALQLAGSRGFVACQSAGDASAGYRAEGGVALDGSPHRLPMQMEFALDSSKNGIDEAPPQPVACCEVTVQLLNARLRLWLDSTESSSLFYREGSAFLGLALTGVIERGADPGSADPAMSRDGTEDKPHEPCEKFRGLLDGRIALGRTIWVELPIERTGDLVTIGSRHALPSGDVFPHAPNPTADWNRDLAVDDLDLNAFYGDPTVFRDLNGDGIYNSLDEARFLGRWSAAQG